MMQSQTRDQVFVVDDDEAVRDSIRLLLSGEGLAVRCFADGEECRSSFAGNTEPGCIVSDVRLPGLSGLELQTVLNDQGVRSPLILITGHGEIDMAVRAIKAGAFDFLEKPFDPARLIASVRGALAAAAKNRASQVGLDDIRARVAQLSERQREVMDLAVLGFSNKEIAQQLSISPRTVKSYRAWVMEKTGTANLAELVRIAMRIEQQQ